MRSFHETEITQAIIDGYYRNLRDRIVNDVLIVGAGPAGTVAGYYLAKAGYKTTIVERNLAPGGGIWGGGMGMNQVVIQEEALPIVQEMKLRYQACENGAYTVNAVELATGLVYHALQAGVEVFNLVTLEDVSVHDQTVTGVVVNRTGISGRYHVDPLTFSAKAVLDATGHEAMVLNHLRRRGFFDDTPIAAAQEGPMNAAEGEEFVVSRAGEVFPGLWVAGMSVCSAYGGPRMGPIFGGMLLSGRRVAQLIAEKLGSSD